jgi:subtilisin family serine protease
MATAHASGVVALLLDLAPLAAAPEIRATILSAVTDLGATGTDTQYGEGLIDACSAANHVTSGAVICGETTDD